MDLALNGQGCCLHTEQYFAGATVTTRAGRLGIAGEVDAVVVVVVVVVFVASMDASMKMGMAALDCERCLSTLLILLCFL